MPLDPNLLLTLLAGFGQNQNPFSFLMPQSQQQQQPMNPPQFNSIPQGYGPPITNFSNQPPHSIPPNPLQQLHQHRPMLPTMGQNTMNMNMNMNMNNPMSLPPTQFPLQPQFFQQQQPTSYPMQQPPTTTPNLLPDFSNKEPQQQPSQQQQV
jgi:hypothetical protein